MSGITSGEESYYQYNDVNDLRCSPGSMRMSATNISKNDSCAVARGLVGKLRRVGSNVHSHGGQLNKMADGRSFREVALHSDRNGGKTADFTIPTTLTTTVKDEDYAKSHVGGGYAYRESGLADAVTRNRFIFWSVL